MCVLLVNGLPKVGYPADILYKKTNFIRNIGEKSVLDLIKYFSIAAKSKQHPHPPPAKSGSCTTSTAAGWGEGGLRLCGLYNPKLQFF